MKAKTKAHKNRRLVTEDDQQPNQNTEPTPEEVLLSSSDPEARQLFDLAIQVKELKPWRWMAETDLIGIENPETGEIGFISVMGAIGQHEAVALYLGAEGLYGFIDLHQKESLPESIMAVNHIQVAFSDRKYLEKEDLNLIKELGLKFKGANAWPHFLSYRAGYIPWLITVEEARFLIQALAQILDVARKVRDEPQPFRPTGRVERGGFLMRVARREGPGLIWEDQVWRIPKPRSEPIRAIIEASALESLRHKQRSGLEFQIGVRLFPGRIGPPSQRPIAAYLLMMADRDSGFIFGHQLMTAEDSLATMYSRIPNVVAQLLDKAPVFPGRIAVRSDKLRSVLKPLAQKLNVELRYTDDLASIDEAMESMTAFMQTKRVN